MPETIIFTILAFFVVVGGLAVIIARSPATSAIGFFAALVALAGIFALLHQSFLFLAQLLVSVGAVVVLTLIVILSVNLKRSKEPREPLKWVWILLSVLLVAPLGRLIYRSLHSALHAFPPAGDIASTKAVGATLFGGWVLPFEILSLLLLVAMLGAIVIGKKEQSYDLHA